MSLTESPISDDELLTKYGRLIRHVAFTVCRSYRFSQEDRDDIVQEITIQLLKLPAERRSQEGYVRVVINNCARNCINKIMRRGGGGIGDWTTIDYASAAPYTDIENEGSTLIDVVSPLPASPEEQIHRQAYIAQALSGLSPEHRAVVIAFYLEDKSVEEIAERYRVTRQAIEGRIKAAIRKLRARLK